MKPQHANAPCGPAEVHPGELPDSSSLSEAKLGGVDKLHGKTRRRKRGGKKRNQKLQERLFIEYLVEERIKQIRMYMEATQLAPVQDLSVEQISSHLSQMEINPSNSDGNELKDYEYYCSHEQRLSELTRHTPISGYAAVAASNGYNNVPTISGYDNYGYNYAKNSYYYGYESGNECHGYTNPECDSYGYDYAGNGYDYGYESVYECHGQTNPEYDSYGYVTCA